MAEALSPPGAPACGPRNCARVETFIFSVHQLLRVESQETSHSLLAPRTLLCCSFKLRQAEPRHRHLRKHPIPCHCLAHRGFHPRMLPDRAWIPSPVLGAEWGVIGAIAWLTRCFLYPWLLTLYIKIMFLYHVLFAYFQGQKNILSFYFDSQIRKRHRGV